MDPYSSFWDEHDFYIYGCHNSFSKFQYQDTDLAGYLAFYRCFGRYLGRLVERLYFTSVFLAPYSRWRFIWYRIRNCSGPGILGDVWDSKKLFTALAENFKRAKKIDEP